jgi:large subunit ribosomal protein L13
MQTSYFPKAADLKPRWVVVDVDGLTLGRAATQIAHMLRGKHRPTWTRGVDCGDFVVVLNADKIRLSGKKWTDKMYHFHSNFPGGIRSFTAEQFRAHKPTELIRLAVKRMIPPGALGRKTMKRLKVYASNTHPHAAQQPKPVKLAADRA